MEPVALRRLQVLCTHLDRLADQRESADLAAAHCLARQYITLIGSMIMDVQVSARALRSPLPPLTAAALARRPPLPLPPQPSTRAARFRDMYALPLAAWPGTLPTTWPC